MSRVVSDTVNIEAAIRGEIKGQVAIGSNILQIGSVHGGVVNIAMPGTITPPTPRPRPVILRPRSFPGLLDRHEETDRVAAALRSAEPIELCGEAGLGKTSLLRYLAYYAFDTRYPDGIVHFSLRRQSALDVLQSLYEAFYESGNPFNVKPTEVQIRFALQDKQALILFDDVDLAREELEAVMDAAPGCTFVISSAERQLWGEGSTLSLAGLPLDDAMTLFERELGRPLTDDERPEAKLLCIALEGHPLRLIQAAAIFRGERRSVAPLISPETSTPAQALAGHVITSLSEPERQIVMSLAALGDASVRTEHLAGMTGLSNTEPILDSLAQRAVIRAENGGYRLDGTLAQELQQQPDAGLWIEKALAYFVEWTAKHGDRFKRVVSESDVIDRVLDSAVKAQRWREALRLVMSIEGALALGRRWGAWDRVLRIGLDAARALRDRPAEAWALHQIGTRAQCLEQVAAARSSFIMALRLRESIDDLHGAAVTRHNLNVLLGPPAPPGEPPQQPPSPHLPIPGVTLFSSALLAVILVTVAALGVVQAGRGPQAPTPALPMATPSGSAPSLTPAPSATAMPTAIATATPTPTASPTPTATSTSTPTSTPTWTPSPVPCIPRYGWPIYIVQFGDALTTIAYRTGSTAYELMRANCLASGAIYAGQALLVPWLPAVPPTITFTPAPTFTPSSTTRSDPAVINFWADAYEIAPGQCTILHWELKNVAGAYLSSGKAVEGAGAQDVCQKETATYTLYVKLLDGNADYRTITIHVTQPTPKTPDTPAPVPDTPTPAIPDTPAPAPDTPMPEPLLTPTDTVPLTALPQLS
jgi:hypothetical protein